MVLGGLFHHYNTQKSNIWYDYTWYQNTFTYLVLDWILLFWLPWQPHYYEKWPKYRKWHSVVYLNSSDLHNRYSIYVSEHEGHYIQLIFTHIMEFWVFYWLPWQQTQKMSNFVEWVFSNIFLLKSYIDWLELYNYAAVQSWTCFTKYVSVLEW